MCRREDYWLCCEIDCASQCRQWRTDQGITTSNTHKKIEHQTCTASSGDIIVDSQKIHTLITVFPAPSRTRMGRVNRSYNLILVSFRLSSIEAIGFMASLFSACVFLVLTVDVLTTQGRIWGWLVTTTPPPGAAAYFMLLCAWLKLFRCRIVPLLEPNRGDTTAKKFRSVIIPTWL